MIPLALPAHLARTVITDNAILAIKEDTPTMLSPSVAATVPLGLPITLLLTLVHYALLAQLVRTPEEAWAIAQLVQRGTTAHLEVKIV